jgi:hypothetical protein
MAFSNFSFITSRLATGGGPATIDDLKYLMSLGITHVIDVRSISDAGAVTLAPRLSFLWNPTMDDGQSKPTWWFQVSIQFAIPGALQMERTNKVYVHCDQGINRGPSTAYAILRAWTGMTHDDAEWLIIKHRPQTIPPIGLRYRADADKALKELGYIE